MCRIDIDISSLTTRDGTTIDTGSIICRYKKTGGAWSSSEPVSYSNPQTPNISEVGDYVIQLSFSNSAGESSGWLPDNTNNGLSFRISNECNPVDYVEEPIEVISSPYEYCYTGTLAFVQGATNTGGKLEYEDEFGNYQIIENVYDISTCACVTVTKIISNFGIHHEVDGCSSNSGGARIMREYKMSAKSTSMTPGCDVNVTALPVGVKNDNFMQTDGIVYFTNSTSPFDLGNGQGWWYYGSETATSTKSAVKIDPSNGRITDNQGCYIDI